jgi:ribosome-associated toxin RatA of RatAB toxin-antitoxin module
VNVVSNSFYCARHLRGRKLRRRHRESLSYARRVPIVSKTIEVAAAPETIMAIVGDFEAYPEWNNEIKGCWVLARYDDGRPSQLRLDVAVQGMDGSYICAVYYPSPSEIYTVLQQGDLFSKQQQNFSVVPMGSTSLLTVDLDVETKTAIPKPIVKKVVNDALEYLADNLKKRAEELGAA